MIDLSKPLETRKGHAVTILTTESGDPKAPVVGVIETPVGKRVAWWGSNGEVPMPSFVSPHGRNILFLKGLRNKPEEPVVRYSRLSGDPENGGVRLGLWRKTQPKTKPTDTGILKLSCVDGIPVSAEIIAA